MSRWVALLFLLGIAVGLGACASTNSNNPDNPDQSSIPWNRPQKWEGPGVYGSAINQGM
jgi:hypothetical protein